jgi:hypothetical protein
MYLITADIAKIAEGDAVINEIHQSIISFSMEYQLDARC